jgi:hypothetical protein
VTTNGWRRAKAMLHFDKQGELRRQYLISAVQRNKNAQLRLKALQEISAARDPEAFDQAVEIMGGWTREEKREGSKIMLLALAEKRIGRRDQANNWIWHMAEYTREVHEEYAVQRWPETKRLLGLLVNSSGGAHARNARRLVQAARKQDRRLSAALLAAALAHTPEAAEAVNGARTRMARKPSALARELLRNFPKGKRGRGSRRRKRSGRGADGAVAAAGVAPAENGAVLDDDLDDRLDAVLQATDEEGEGVEPAREVEAAAAKTNGGSSRSSRRRRRRRKQGPREGAPVLEAAEQVALASSQGTSPPAKPPDPE